MWIKRVCLFYNNGGSETMSIRLIAQDLYRLQQEVDKIEKQIKNAPYQQQEKLKDQLRMIKAERDRIRRMLDGSKDSPTYPVGKLRI